MSRYVHFTEEQKQRANAVDLEDFLTRQGEKLLRSGREKRIASDHSITVRGNRWYDHATAKGGCAIDFVRTFYQQSFPDAVTMLLGGEQGQGYLESKPKEVEPPKPFDLPQRYMNSHRMFAYLTKTRCLAPSIVSSFIKEKMIYEDATYHNAVFVGYDENGIPRHAHRRGTYTKGKAFKGNVESSDPKYSFRWIGQSDTVYVFEAPIDLLSFLSIYQRDWEQHSYVALCGVGEHALMQTLTDAPNIKRVVLCLDNDQAGIQAQERIKKHLEERGYTNVFSLFSHQKDWNEDLQQMNKPPPEIIEEQQAILQMG